MPQIGMNNICVVLAGPGSRRRDDCWKPSNYLTAVAMCIFVSSNQFLKEIGCNAFSEVLSDASYRVHVSHKSDDDLLCPLDAKRYCHSCAGRETARGISWNLTILQKDYRWMIQIFSIWSWYLISLELFVKAQWINFFNTDENHFCRNELWKSFSNKGQTVFHRAESCVMRCSLPVMCSVKFSVLRPS